jgi:hypothetical protein
MFEPFTEHRSVVDKALEVIDEYHSKIVKFEREILIKPDIATIRNRMFSYLLSDPHLTSSAQSISFRRI